MPSLAIPVSGLSLGSSQAGAASHTRSLDILNLTLSDEVIEDMIKCVRGKNGLQLSLGSDPKIVFGSQNIQLASSSEPFPCEYFRTSVAPQSTTSGKMAAKPRQLSGFWGAANKRLAPTIPNIRTELLPRDGKAYKTTTASRHKSPQISAIAGADAALSQLQSSLALADAQKKSNTTMHVKNTASLPPQVQQKGTAHSIKPGNKARFLAQNPPSKGSDATRSVPASPYLNGIDSPALPPTSVPLSQQQAEKTKAIRRPIIHMLATGPLTEEALSNAKGPGTSEDEFRQALEKVADRENGMWKLSQKSYKDLDVWSYKKYSTEQRTRAVENAIRAYDKMRLSATAPEWDRLLPEEERGKGKSLSKIQAKIATGTIQPAKGPRIRVHGTDDSGRDTAAEEEDLFGDKAAVGGEPMARSYSNPPIIKSKKVSEKEARAKRLLGKPAKAKPAAPKVEKKVAEANKHKSSKFVSDSDEGEDTYLVEPTPKATTKPAVTKTSRPAAAASKPSTKRARDESDDVAPQAKVRKTLKGISTSPQKSSPLASSATNASDFEDSSSSAPARPLKRKPLEYADLLSAKRHQHSSSVSTSSSISSSVGPSTGSGGVAINGVNGARAHDWAKVKEAETSTRRFAAYYVQYKKMYEKVQASNPKNAEEYADLMDMHERLFTMKGEILRKNGL